MTFNLALRGIPSDIQTSIDLMHIIDIDSTDVEPDLMLHLYEFRVKNLEARNQENNDVAVTKFIQHYRLALEQIRKKQPSKVNIGIITTKDKQLYHILSADGEYISLFKGLPL